MRARGVAPAAQRGVFLIEALVAILIFSIGILGLVSLGAVAISAQSDAQYRTEASNLANKIVAEISLDMERGSYATELPKYAHHATDDGRYCVFTGAASEKPVVAAWSAEALPGASGTHGLPGATASAQQIKVDTALNRVTVTLCWRPPGGPDGAASVGSPSTMHRHTLVAYIN